MKTILFTVSFLIGGLAYACDYDIDCQVGSKCIKRAYSQAGVCMGGIWPGNSNDRKPVYNPQNRRDKVGKTCSYDIDCSYGRSCMKGAGKINGVCY
jgi:hypothetical protein